MHSSLRENARSIYSSVRENAIGGVCMFGTVPVRVFSMRKVANLDWLLR